MVDNKVRHPLLDIYRKNVSLMKINNTKLMLCTRITLLFSFVIYVFCICHSGKFPIMCLNSRPSDPVSH